MIVPTFDLEPYLKNSKKLEVEDLDWDAVREHPLTDEEIRALTYDMDIESNTIIYVRELLSTPAADDPQITAFLSCWAYEEFFHGHMIKRFLRAYGVPVSEGRLGEVIGGRSIGFQLWQLGQALVSKALGHRFIAVHMTWGAIHELTTLQGYTLMAQRTRHPVLRELLQRIVKDERRHFSFYYHQAKARLQDPVSRGIVSTLVNRFWDVVGAGEVPDAEVDFLVTYLLGDREDDPRGRETIDYLQKTIRSLPGLEQWDGPQRILRRTLARRADLRGAALPSMVSQGA